MICPECCHDHLGDIPNGLCVMCGADMSHTIAESDADESADNIRQDSDLRKDK